MNREQKRERRAQAGFTLMEILLVVVIIGVLAAIVAPRLAGRSKQAKEGAAKAGIHSLGLAIEVFELDTGSFPRSLQALISNPGKKGWKGPYLKKRQMPEDPWGNAYHYSYPGTRGVDYDLSSSGADGTSGTADDINSWD